MLKPGDRVKVRHLSERCATWEGEIIYRNAAKYGIRLDKTPSIVVFFFHKDIEGIK